MFDIIYRDNYKNIFLLIFFYSSSYRIITAFLRASIHLFNNDMPVFFMAIIYLIEFEKNNINIILEIEVK
jgi:hypothetical protein